MNGGIDILQLALNASLFAGRVSDDVGARIVEAAVIIDLPALGGSARLQAAGIPGFALLSY